jgi:3-hydroxy acid dehydrogenase / malonic semialdehyde reductase
MIKTVFITGATSGIGQACAKAFASKGQRIIICGRRSKRLQTLKKQLEEIYHVEVLAIELDVRNRAAVGNAISKLPENWISIDILVNNAGLALGLNSIGEGEHDDWDQMIDTNVKGLLYISRAIIPGMMERKSGHIINIGSIAGRETYPNGNVYCATKYAVDAITQGMRLDLVSYGIKVTQISPGATETEFSKVRFNGDTERANNVYKGFKPLSGDDIANAIIYVASLPPHVNINDMLIMPVSQANATTIHRE